MNNEEYQRLTSTTAIYPKHNALEYLTIGLGGEVGELQGKIAKLYRKDIVGTPYSDSEFASKDGIDMISDSDQDAIREELGDVLWFCSELCNLFGWELGEVMEKNIAKLKGRAERGTLEGSGDKR